MRVFPDFGTLFTPCEVPLSSSLHRRPRGIAPRWTSHKNEPKPKILDGEKKQDVLLMISGAFGLAVDSEFPRDISKDVSQGDRDCKLILQTSPRPVGFLPR